MIDSGSHCELSCLINILQSNFKNVVDIIVDVTDHSVAYLSIILISDSEKEAYMISNPLRTFLVTFRGLADSKKSCAVSGECRNGKRRKSTSKRILLGHVAIRRGKTEQIASVVLITKRSLLSRMFGCTIQRRMRHTSGATSPSVTVPPTSWERSYELC